MSIKTKFNEINNDLKPFAAKRPITLLAVSKGQSITAIEEAFQAGCSDFGENYWQEAKTKIHSLSHLPIHWHFIGPIQSNKSKDIASHFDWVQSVDRPSIALKLNQYRPDALGPLNVCIQVNLNNEASKSGCGAEDVLALADLILSLPKLKLRGLMAIPKEEQAPNAQEKNFLALAKLFDQLNRQSQASLDTLSMGMSRDWQLALSCGSTCIRLGRALFGERHKEVLS